MSRRKAKQAPSETYAARVARGRVQVTVTLAPASVALLDVMAAHRGQTKSETVAAALALLFAATPRPGDG